jgi:hypothetical protein
MKKRLFCLCMAVVFWHGYAFAGYVDNGNGTVTDTSTGLMWQKDTAWGTYTWDMAKAYCENLTLGEQSDWRLPTRIELQSIVDYNAYGPSIDTAFFPDTKAKRYWSSTFSQGHQEAVWYVDFFDGEVSENVRRALQYVRAVRGGQCAIKTTTTTACPLTTALGEDSTDLENLRSFRDNTLAQSALGRRIIRIYYDNAESINGVLERNPSLQSAARRVLKMIAPMVGW